MTVNSKCLVFHCINHKLHTTKWVGTLTISTVFGNVEAEYSDVFYLTEVCWLSGDATLKHFSFLLLLKEVNIFINDNGKNIPQLSEKHWILDLAF